MVLTVSLASRACGNECVSSPTHYRGPASLAAVTTSTFEPSCSAGPVSASAVLPPRTRPLTESSIRYLSVPSICIAPPRRRRRRGWGGDGPGDGGGDDGWWRGGDSDDEDEGLGTGAKPSPWHLHLMALWALICAYAAGHSLFYLSTTALSVARTAAATPKHVTATVF